MSLTIYRIQDNRGRGPFSPGFTCLWFDDRSEDEAALLAPFEMRDVHNAITTRPRHCRHMGYGCRDLATLRRWFLPNEYLFLLSHGFEAVELPDCMILLEAPLQVMFARRRPLAMDARPFDLYPSNTPMEARDQ